MNIQITGLHNLEITPAIKDYVNTKLNKITKHFDHITKCSVIFWIEHGEHFAEGNIFVPNHDLVAKSSGKNMYSAIDNMKDKLDKQVIKNKEKMTNHRENRDHKDILENDDDI